MPVDVISLTPTIRPCAQVAVPPRLKTTTIRERAFNATAMNAKAQPYLDFRMWWP
jgi:hypothetical protein